MKKCLGCDKIKKPTKADKTRTLCHGRKICRCHECVDFDIRADRNCKNGITNILDD